MEKILVNTQSGQVQVWFARQGSKLAVYHHGVPKPRQLNPAELEVFANHGYSVAAIVRPGYLESEAAAVTPSMADIAEATEAVISHLGFERFLSVGFSGGGPRALANVAKVPLADAAVLIGSVAASHLDFDYLGSLPEEEREFMTAIREHQRGLLPQFENWAAATPEFDHGAIGWVDDEISMLTDWGFNLADVQRPVVLIASPEDANVPISHSRWLNSKLPTSRLIEVHGVEHDALVNPQNLEAALPLIGD